MTKVLLVDDDRELAGLLRQYLARDGFQVTTAGDGESGLAEAVSGRHAIVVLDVMMPGMDGLEVLRRLRRTSALPVLMLTARGDDADCVAGLELGADDYVAKPCTPRTLVARLRAILRRTQAPGTPAGPPSQPLTCDGLTLWPEQRRAMWHGRRLELTSTELSVLQLLLRNAGHPVSKSELSEQALGRPLIRHDRSIDVHVSNVRRKLGTLPDGRSRIQAVHRIGYQFIRE